MDMKKRNSFVKKCGKKRRSFSKGGVIRKIGNKHYFDDGGTVLAGPNTNSVSQNAVNPNTGVLGTISNALGLNDQFQAGAAQINPGTNTAQLNNAYTGAQTGLNNQNTLVGELQPQVPVAVQNQLAVAQQEKDMLNGVGPNPALTQLNQTTGQNIAGTTAAMAGVRGSSVNPALIAREAAQQGAATEQNAVGQAATLSAEQQVAARQDLANLSNNQISQTGQAVTNANTANQNEQSILQGANTAANNAAVGMQSNINNTNAATAAANQNMQGNVLGGIGAGISAVSNLFEEGGVVGEDGDKIPEHLKIAEMNAHSINHSKKLKMADGGGVTNLGSSNYVPQAPQPAPNIPSSSPLPVPQEKSGGSGGGGGGIMSLAALLANGGKVSAPNLGSSNFAQQSSQAGPNIESMQALPANEENFADDVNGLKKKPQAPTTVGEAQPWELGGGMAGGPMDNNLDMNEGPQYAAQGGMMKNYCAGPHDSHVANFLHGGKVEAMVSPDEVYLSPEKVREVIHEGANPLKIGLKIPGKAKVKGDSLKNDTVPMTLEEGGVVIPRHVTRKMSPEKAELFVHRALARKKARA